MSKLRITRQSDRILEFTLNGLHHSSGCKSRTSEAIEYCRSANILRRTIIRDIPTLAIDQVIIFDNTSSLANEMIAHRLCLIPLVYDSSISHDSIEDTEFMLDITCSEGIRNVLSQDLVSNNNTKCALLKNVILTKLFPGQTLKFKATIKSGTGSEHAKWSPVTGVSFCPDAKIKDKFHFVVESNGTLTPMEIVQTAFQILEDKVTDIYKQFDTSALFKPDTVVNEIVVR